MPETTEDQIMRFSKLKGNYVRQIPAAANISWPRRVCEKIKNKNVPQKWHIAFKVSDIAHDSCPCRRVTAIFHLSMSMRRLHCNITAVQVRRMMLGKEEKRNEIRQKVICKWRPCATLTTHKTTLMTRMSVCYKCGTQHTSPFTTHQRFGTFSGEIS